MMRVRAGVLGLAVFLAGAVPPAARAGAPTKYSSDDLGRLASVTTELGTTKYTYFDSGSIAEMVDPGGWRYSFTEGDAPATLASAVPNFLQSLATAVSSPLDQSANRFLFTGFMYEREIGLYLTPSGRLYDPSSGRFIQQDSHLGTVSEPPSLHRYFYGNANPLRYVDPTGHETATAGCYWGPSSCGPQNVPLTGVEKRAFAGLLGTLSWAGKAALETVNLALGRHWEGFGESFLKAADHPIDAAVEAKGRLETHVNASLDRAQERLDKGDDFGAAFGFTEQITAPTAAAVVGAGDLAVGAVRTGSRLLARAPAVEVPPPPPTPQLRPVGLSVESSAQAGKGFVVTEDGLMPAIGGGSQGADALLAEPVTAPLARPSWQAAQTYAGDELKSFGFKDQPSYLEGKAVPYGTRGSVRPDLASEPLKLAVDVKNYDVSTAQGRYRLVQDIVGQTGSRAANLPEGMRQGVIIDLRGQQISDKLLNSMLGRIVDQSKGTIQLENIHVQR